MSAYSFDKPKFTSAREKEKENNKQKHQKFAMHNLPEQYDLTDHRHGKKEMP